MRKFTFFILFLFFLSFLSYASAREADLRIHFINVGEGDSILIEADEKKAALIDTGNFNAGIRVGEYLNKHNIKELEHLILTHAHPDHIGAVFFIKPMLEIGTIYDNAEDLSGLTGADDIYHSYEELVRRSSNYKALKAGDSIRLGNAVLDILWPPEQHIFADPNANSLVIMLKSGQFRCLLAGDLTSAGEEELIARGVNLKADVLKVGHHGAGDATSQEFLNGVSPQIAIISAKAEDVRGQPSRDVIKRLKRAGIKVYRTDEDGDIILEIYASAGRKARLEVKAGR